LEALGINLGYLISQIVNFSLLALLLYFVGYKPILRVLDERSARIRQGMADAEKAQRMAAEAQQEFERQLALARKESQALIAQATQTAQKQRDEILAQAREQAAAELARAKEEIARERERALVELRQEIADLSVTVAEKVIGQTLDLAAQRRLVQRFIEQVGELP